jgi:hypothetical protein
MAVEPQYLSVTGPALFDNFVECQTRGQRRRQAIGRLKFAVKWMLNWKGIRNR